MYIEDLGFPLQRGRPLSSPKKDAKGRALFCTDPDPDGWYIDSFPSSRLDRILGA